MKYSISISGYGSEQVHGTLTKEQYDFWKDLEEEDIIAHAFDDPWDDTDENPVFDDADKRFLGHWNELDDLLHHWGADAGGAYIDIEDEDGNQIIGQSWDDFEEEQDAIITHVDEEECAENAEYVFSGSSAEKGNFGQYELVTNEPIDLSKLEFCLTDTPDGTMLDLLSYNGEELDNDGGDTTGKGYYARVWEN